MDVFIPGLADFLSLAFRLTVSTATCFRMDDDSIGYYVHV